MSKPTPEMLADSSLGACKRMREGCGELGSWRPFYQGYVCEECITADQADVRRGILPWLRKYGLGIPLGDDEADRGAFDSAPGHG